MDLAHDRILEGTFQEIYARLAVSTVQGLGQIPDVVRNALHVGETDADEGQLHLFQASHHLLDVGVQLELLSGKERSCGLTSDALQSYPLFSSSSRFVSTSSLCLVVAWRKSKSPDRKDRALIGRFMCWA